MSAKTPRIEASTAPATTSSPVVLSTTPPVVNIPAPPAGSGPIDLTEFRGSHATSAQVAAVPDTVAELLGSDTYTENLGPAAPPVARLVTTLDNAVGWTAIRIALEAYLPYVKGQEGLAWKASLVQIGQAKVAYDAALQQNAQLPTLLPALTRLFDAKSATARKAANSRKRAKAAKAAAVTHVATSGANAPATTAPAASVTATAPVTTAPVSGTGGAIS